MNQCHPLPGLPEPSKDARDHGGEDDAAVALPLHAAQPHGRRIGWVAAVRVVLSDAAFATCRVYHEIAGSPGLLVLRAFVPNSTETARALAGAAGLLSHLAWPRGVHRHGDDGTAEDLAAQERRGWGPGVLRFVAVAATAACVVVNFVGVSATTSAPLLSAAFQRRAATQVACVLAAAAGVVATAGALHGARREQQLPWYGWAAEARLVVSDAGLAAYHVLRRYVPNLTQMARALTGAGGLLAYVARQSGVVHGHGDDGAAEGLHDDDDDDHHHHDAANRGRAAQG
jgi:hypothetical protein